ncbi:MAG: hypothetical protein KDA57_14185 [Planctomycetales bacterium]|nr:hypothetical protein [Planctomycetales bacterium]
MALGKRRRNRHARSQRQANRKSSRSAAGRSLSSTPLSRILRLEQLEERQLLTVYPVNNFFDLYTDGTPVEGSLRQVVQLANANPGFDTIVFQDYLFDGPGGAFIALSAAEGGGPLLLTDESGIEIIGPGPGKLTISAPGNNRIFLVDDTNEDNFSNVTISGVTLTGGNPLGDDEDGRGGAILNRERLTLTEVAIENSFAPKGGGAVFSEFGRLTIESSLIQGNSSGFGGGGIQNGLADQMENFASTTITNSTITGNSAFGIPDGDTLTGYGGGVLNLAGTVTVEQSTVYGNTSTDGGGGVASQGFDAMYEDQDGDVVPTVFSGLATLVLRSSIIVGNFDNMGASDVGSIGMTTGDDEMAAQPFDPQIDSLGYNLFGKLTHPSSTANDFVALPPSGPGDVANVDPTDVFVDGGLQDFGGVLPVFMPDNTKAGGLLAIDQGDPDIVEGPYDQRGYQFTRTFDATTPNGPLQESEPNDTLATAQDLETAGWSLESDPNILNSTDIPHITIEGTGDGSFDYYKFEIVNDGDFAFFDIDFGDTGDTGSFDSELFLYAEDGTLLAENDDFAATAGARGSTDDHDAFLGHQFTTAGIYIIGVGKFNSSGDPGGITGTPPEVDDTYTLHISVQDHGVNTSGFPGRMDIGAAEVQLGNFLVDTLADDLDGRFSPVPVVQGSYPGYFTIEFPDFSIREALEATQKNQQASTQGVVDTPGLTGRSVIGFDPVLQDAFLNPDPKLNTAAPTILLDQGQLAIDFPVLIQGPSFELEIDGSGIGGQRIFQVFDEVEISNLVLRGGEGSLFGGAILLSSGDLTVRNSTLLDNETSGTGGAIHVASGNLLVEASTIYDNVSASSGGGIFIASGDVTISNSTITGNTGVLHGGGITNSNGNLAVRYSTITLNTAGSTQGSGIASFRDQSATTSIRSSIISGNTLTDVSHVKPGTDNVTSLGYNLVNTGNTVYGGVFSQPGDLLPSANPMLGPLVRLGGPTSVHRLLTGSDAIDAGDADPVGLGNVPAYDQRGFPFDRITEPPGGSERLDIGAFEVQTGVIFVGDGSPEEGSYSSFAAALADANLSPLKEKIVFLPSAPKTTSGSFGITDSVEVYGDMNGIRFSGASILVDNGTAALIDVSFDDTDMVNNTRIVNKENLSLSNIDFTNNSSTENGGVISSQVGKLKIDNGLFVGNSVTTAGKSGGAIHVLNGNLEINNTLLSGNTAAGTGGKGGAIYHRGGTFSSNYMYVTGNTATAATGRGGGIYARESALLLSNATISGNRTTGSNSEGGGLAAKDSSVVLVNPAVAFNKTFASQSQGGGIFVNGGSLMIQGGNFFGNRTYGQSSPGGGISSVNASVLITGTSMNLNETSGSTSHGGGINAVGGNLILRDSAVINNVASGAGSNGGGIYSDTDLSGTKTTSIINSTLSGNSTNGLGGGLFNADGKTVIRHSTITNNNVLYVGSAGGVGSYGNSSTTLTQVYSTIIAGNTATPPTPVIGDFDSDSHVDGFDFLIWQSGFGKNSGAALSDGDANGDMKVDAADMHLWELGYGTGVTPSDADRVGGAFNETFQSLGYNLVGSGLSLAAFNQAGDITGVDPMLGPLTLNGGTFLGNHALLEGSPAINAGDPGFIATSVTPALLYDQRGVGFDRVAQGRIDIGAFEVPDALEELVAAASYVPAIPDAPLDDVADEPVALRAASIEPSASKADTPLAASAAPQPVITGNYVAVPARTSPAEQSVKQLRDAALQVARSRAGIARNVATFSEQLPAVPSSAVLDEFRLAAHDALLARFAAFADQHAAVSEGFHLDDLVVSRLRHQACDDSSEETYPEDLVFDFLGKQNV